MHSKETQHENNDEISFIKKLIEIRKKYNVFKIDRLIDVENNISISSNILNTIFYNLKDEKENLKIIFKTNETKEPVELKDYIIVLSNLDYTNNELSGIGTMVLRRKL